MLEPGKWISSQQSAGNGACVEVMDFGNGVLVRDSKNPSGPLLTFTYDEWKAFTLGAQEGEFDL